MGWNAIQIIPAVVASAFGLFYGGGALLILAGKVNNYMLARLERRRWVTTYWNECPTCRRCEVTRTAMYDADLGWDCVSTFDVCWSCRYHENQHLDIDFDTMSAADIARLVPDDEHAFGQVPRIRPQPRATLEGRMAANAAAE